MRILSLAFLFAFLAPAQQLMAQDPGAMPDAPADSAGFTDALFESAIFTTMFIDSKTMAVRFYNVLVPPGNKDGSAMAVGIRTDGSEINGGKAYKVSLGFVGGVLKTNDLTSKNAKKACSAMQASGHGSYSASFTRTELESLIGLPGCQAVQVTPDVTDKGETTMRLTAMKIADGKAVPLGSGPEYERVCGFPCPSVCGPSTNYVYRAPK